MFEMKWEVLFPALKISRFISGTPSQSPPQSLRKKDKKFDIFEGGNTCVQKWERNASNIYFPGNISRETSSPVEVNLQRRTSFSHLSSSPMKKRVNIQTSCCRLGWK